MATLIGLDAVAAAALADELLVQGGTLQSVWRYAIVQLLDDYLHELAREGADVAARRFDREPVSTRSPEVDAALAAWRNTSPGGMVGRFPSGPASQDDIRRRGGS